tara:strand:- start:426 stop:2099 length:1674 start_codon:yes stop_codon:yes gene_type:complete
MSSLTNQIVANIKKTSTNFNSFSFVNSENVVCIDTSLNRIGINRKTPVYSIDISGDTSNNAVRVHNLHIHNLAKIKEISCNRLDTEIFTVNEMDVSGLTFNLLTGKSIDLSLLITDDISTSKMYVPELSCNDFDVSGNINTHTINISKQLYAQKIIADVIIFPIVDLSYMSIDISADIIYLSNNDLCNNQLTSYEISVNRLFVKDKFISIGEASYNHIHVDGDASLNNLYVDTQAVLNELSANKIEFNELSGNTINADTITSNGTTIINNGVFGDAAAPTNAVFNNLVVSRLDISNLYITNYLDNSGLTDLSNGMLILPGHKTEYNSQTFQPGTITFDDTFNILKLYNTNPVSRWNNILLNTNFATMSLRKDISGNDISYDIHRLHYEIDRDNSDNLILDKVNYPNIKYIPITYDVSFGNKIDISNNNQTIEIINREQDELFEIHATVGIKYLNRDPGDVEPNVYTFGLYPHMNTFNKIKDSIDNSFVHFNNTVVVFDNSFNYANTTINYIGPLANSVLGQNISDRSGFNFYISSNKDINYIVIDQFNGTIKQLQKN